MLWHRFELLQQNLAAEPTFYKSLPHLLPFLTTPCFIWLHAASILPSPLHNKPPPNLSWNPSFAGYSERQIMLIFHLDSGRWSQVFGSSSVFRCNCAGDGTWRAAADEGWGVESFWEEGHPTTCSLKNTQQNEEKAKTFFWIPSC